MATTELYEAVLAHPVTGEARNYLVYAENAPRATSEATGACFGWVCVSVVRIDVEAMAAHYENAEILDVAKK